MPGLKYAPSRGQNATHFSFADIAEFAKDDLVNLKDRIQDLVLHQDLPLKTDWIDTAKFVLADRSQVESRDWCSLVRPAVVVRCVGKDTEKYRYGFEPSAEVVTPDIPVCYGAARDARLRLCLWDIVKALSQGRAVVVHCNQSFHRGPCGLMAILKTLLGIPVVATKEMILAKRDVWEGYVGQMGRHGDSLVRAYHWASELKLWRPPVARRAADTWGQRPALTPVAAALQADEGKYLYRAMTPGLVEFDAQPASKEGMEGVQLAHLVLDAVATGSKRVSKFVHFSRKFIEARLWHVLGSESRGETDTIMCRVPISALSQVHDLSRPLRHLEYVDLSNLRVSMPLLSPYQKADRTMLIEPLMGVLSHAAKVSEVLVAWRGSMPRELFEVIHADTGEFFCMLDQTVPLLASSHWRQTSVEAINPAVFKSLCCYSFRCCAIFHFTINFLYLLYPKYTTFAFVWSKLELSICVLVDMLIIVLYFELNCVPDRND